MRAPKRSELRDPQDALRAYLDEMLHLATAGRAAASAAAPRRDGNGSQPRAGGARDGAIEPAPPPAPAPVIEHVPTGQPDPVPAAAAPELGSVADGFRFPLQCLMFRVGGHLLALPLIELAGVIQAETRLTRLPQSPAEVLGLLQHRERTLRVVDSGALLGIAGQFDAARGHLLLLAAGDWALSCDAPEAVVYLERDAVQWRADVAAGVRYGTIRESLATLLDPGAICDRLERRLGT